MAGYNHRGMVFREVEPYLSEEELIEVAQQERQETEENIPKHDYLKELYGEFEQNSMEYMQTLTELVSIQVALMESADRDIQDTVRSLIDQDTRKIESLRKETEQQANTITYTNLADMLGRMHPASFSKAVWVCHVSTVPQLLQLSIPVGTGGSAYPALSESNGTWKLLTRPVIFTEKTETLGSQGDILLTDFSQYCAGLRQDIRFDVSKDYAFTSDESYGRLIARIDGQPLWDEALTLKDGSTTVSPFVTLQERS